jgi:hypothetical protein
MCSPGARLADGTGGASHARGLKASQYLRKAGYSKVVVETFVTEQ